VKYNFSELIKEIGDKNIKIWFANGKLNYECAEENMTDDIIECLKAFKPQLIKYFWPLKGYTNLLPINTDGNKPPFILVHGDYANYFIYEVLGKSQPFYGFLHLGSEGEKIKFKSAQEYASFYIEQLLTIYPDNDTFLFGGFSFGGLLAFEMTSQLIKMGRKVPCLILLDSASPETRIHNDITSITGDKSYRFNLLYNFLMFWKKNYFRLYFISKRYFRNLYFLFGQKLPAGSRRPYLFDIYTKLTRKYSTNYIYSGDFYLIRAKENKSSEKYLGWEKYANNIKELLYVPGNHETMLEYEESKKATQEKMKEWTSKYSY